MSALLVSVLCRKWKFPLKNVLLLHLDKYIYPEENLEKFKNIKNKIIHNTIIPDITF